MPRCGMVPLHVLSKPAPSVVIEPGPASVVMVPSAAMRRTTKLSESVRNRSPAPSSASWPAAAGNMTEPGLIRAHVAGPPSPE